MTLTAAASNLLPSWEASADVVVVGTGVAGLTAALTTASAGLSVLLITKRQHWPAAISWRDAP